MPFLLDQYASARTPRIQPDHEEGSLADFGVNASSCSLTAEIYQLTATSTTLRRHLSVLLDHQATLDSLSGDAYPDVFPLPNARGHSSSGDVEADLVVLLVLQRTMTLTKRIGTIAARLALNLQCSSTQFDAEGDFSNAEAAIKRVCIPPPFCTPMD